MLLAVVGAVAALASMLSHSAGASHGSSGSIVYIGDGDVRLTSPDGATQVQVTNDGNTPSPDETGDEPYFSPSQTDDGNIIVAVRNQLESNGWLQGYLWVMDRQGNVISKFAPPQWEFIHDRCNDFSQGPRGITQAVVSPDGTRIAYTDRALIRDALCGIDEITAVRVVDIDGSNHQLITREDGTSLDLGQPSWVSGSRLLLNDSNNGGIAYVDLPDPTSRVWTANAAEEGSNFPVLEADKLATTGPSTFFGANELRLWTANGGPPAPPATSRCTLTDPVGGRNFVTPSWAPGGAAVAWWEYTGESFDGDEGEGIWAVSVGDLATTCPTREEAHLIVPGGTWPFWGPAAVSGSGTTTTLPGSTTTTLPDSTTTTLPDSTTTTLPGSTTTTLPDSTTTTLPDSTTTTLPDSTTTTLPDSTTTLPDSTTTTVSAPGSPVVIDAQVVGNGTAVRMTGTVTCDEGNRFRATVDVTQGAVQGTKAIIGRCTGEPQSFRAKVAPTSDGAFQAGIATVEVTVDIWNPDTGTIDDSFSTTGEVTIEVPGGFMGDVVNAFMAMERVGV